MGVGTSREASSPSQTHPKTVLVPPMFERDLKARSRLAKSSYDYLFAKRSLKWLLNDYFEEGLAANLRISPSTDPKISVKAKLHAQDLGKMSIRYQPYGTVEPSIFFDLKANPKDIEEVALRGCWFDQKSGLGTFYRLPIARTGVAAQVGLRYSTPQVTLGSILEPRTQQAKSVWVAGRLESIVLGAQIEPGAPITEFRRDKLTPDAVGDWLYEHTSLAVSYSPTPRMFSGQSSFTATAELQKGQMLMVSFYQHMALNRKVFNVLEDPNVVGITNYLDLGMQLRVPVANSAPQPQGLTIGAAWQANKNLLIKGRLASDSAAGVIAYKTWFHPSFTIAVSGMYSLLDWNACKLGVSLSLENFGNLRYERSHVGQIRGRGLVQRHEATDAEVAMSEGVRPLVRKDVKDEGYQPVSNLSSTVL